MSTPGPFFVPACTGQTAEHAYERLRQRTELEHGRAPTKRRISELWTRRGSVDCITTVGTPDPISGEIVAAIFDLGPHQPFVVYCQDPVDTLQESCEVLGCNAYSVSEFAP